MNAKDLLQKAVDMGASDIFIVAGRQISMRIGENIIQEDAAIMTPADTKQIIEQIYDLSNVSIDQLEETGDSDFSFAIPGLSRFRVNAFKQRGSLSAVLRIISFTLPTPEKYNIPKSIIDIGNLKKGLVLVTGPAGSGKSTTLACIIDYINSTYEDHIITLEDPIEYLHRHKKSIVSQREVPVDTQSYLTALRASLRQSPDVILLGEMRDYETMQVAMTAAETGHLVLSTLHTMGAANTINRIIDVFPANQQRQIAVQLSMVLQAVVSQQLMPGIDKKLVPAFEFMSVTPAIRNMIRENKIPQVDGLLYSSSNETMFSMDNSILELYKNGRITKETALIHASNQEMLKGRLR